MFHKKIGLLAGAAAFLVLILDSRTASAAAAEGIAVCIRSVIPNLFPLFLLSGYLTSALTGGKWLARLFRSPEACGGILLTGLLAGYPVGAKQAAQAKRTGRITRAQAERLLWFCSQAGPSFLFGMAAAQLGGVRQGWALWLVQVFSALSVARLLPPLKNETEHPLPAAPQGSGLMESALRSMAAVCGWVVVFSVLLEFLRRWILWALPPWLQVLTCGLLELTNGILILSGVADPSLRLLLAAVMLNFGGFCVLLQTASVTRELNLRGYLLGKLLQTVFAVLYTLTLLGHTVALIPVFAVFAGKNILLYGNRGSNSVKIGV